MAEVHHPDIKVQSYAGYFNVNKTYNSNMFFWYFPAEIDPENAPVLLWLNGGPGAPSTFGCFLENGPYNLTPDHKITKNPYSWHFNHHMLYIDNPVGTGYSFTDSDAGYATNEVDVANNLFIALTQFFQMFPELQKNDFFATGESYAGKYVPAIGYAILQDILRNDSDTPKINLKGLAIGNGWIDPYNQYGVGKYLYQLGLVDCNGRDIMTAAEDYTRSLVLQRNFEAAFLSIDALFLGTVTPITTFTNLTGFTYYYNYLQTTPPDYSYLNEFMEENKTRRAIHVGNQTFIFGKVEKVAEYLIHDFMDSVAPWLEELLSYYPVLLYYGQLDIVCAYPMAENFMKSLNFTAADEYKRANRCIWWDDIDVAGYAKRAGNLQEVLVRNASHSVPMEQPRWAQHMIYNFTRRGHLC